MWVRGHMGVWGCFGGMGVRVGGYGCVVSRCMGMGGRVSAWIYACVGLYGCVDVGVPVHACVSGWL